jgi:MFS family permease
MRTQIGTLIVATSLVQLANGFFGTFFSLRVAAAGFDPLLTGLVLSSYFAGFTVAAVVCGRIIAQVGHIRAYAAFGGLVVAATVAMPVAVGALPWLAMRALIGFGCAGLFVTTESWLNAKAGPQERGSVFAIYMVGTFLALAAGQILIGWTDVETFGPFNAIALLFAIALVIVCLTRAEPPMIRAAAHLPYGQLSRAAPIAVFGCVISGMITSMFYALVPAWMQGEAVDQGTIALAMLVAVLGGLVLQIPVGRLSDRFDRRLVLAGVSLGVACAAVSVVLLPRTLVAVLPPAAVLGGCMSTLYPVCVANAHDRMPADRVVAVSGRLILVSGLGSVVGPIIGTAVMRAFGLDGVLFLMALLACLLAAAAVASTRLRTAPLHLARPFSVLAPQALPLAHDPSGG